MTIDWTPPTENVDGSALTNLSGYHIHYGTNPNNLTETVKVGSGLTAYTLTDLPSGTYYFAISAYSSTGAESIETGTITAKL